ncbi:MAG: hypothetical protein MJ147_05720 [Clostridia bacterium]|nr:hypothetical protein [Clostridia bacterium]
MATHKFGIMEKAPLSGEEFNEYEPKKYKAISVDDDFIEPLLEKFNNIDCCWHCIDRMEKNLAYTGISLIPPTSMNAFLSALEGSDGTDELRKLFIKARDEEKFVIHFGI